MQINLLKEELYILQDALIAYKYRSRNEPHHPSTKYKIRTIQKKLLNMEDLAKWQLIIQNLGKYRCVNIGINLKKMS